MSSQAVTNNAVLVWEDMKALDRAYAGALEKGDVMNAMKNVLAILTLLNGVSMTRETESADRQTRNVQLLQQMQKWIEEEGLTAKQIAERILEAKGEDITLGPFASLSEALNYTLPDPDHPAFGFLSLDKLMAMVGAAAKDRTGVDLASLIAAPTLEEAQKYNKLMSDAWSSFLSRQQLNFRDGDGDGLSPTMDWVRFQRMSILNLLRTDPQARAEAEAYASAPAGTEKEAAFDTYLGYMETTYPGHTMTLHSSRKQLEDAVRNAPALLADWDVHLADMLQNHGFSDVQQLTFDHLHQAVADTPRHDYDRYQPGSFYDDPTSYALHAQFREDGVSEHPDYKGGYLRNMAEQLERFDAATLAYLQEARLLAHEGVNQMIGQEFAAYFRSVDAGELDLTDPADVAAAAAYFAGPAFATQRASESAQAELDRIMVGTLGIDFSGLKDGLENGREKLAEQIQSQIDVDTRVSDNQALSLKQLLQQQQVLLTMISELVDKETYLKRLMASR